MVDVHSATRIPKGNAQSWNLSDIPLRNWEGGGRADENHEVNQPFEAWNNVGK